MDNRQVINNLYEALEHISDDNVEAIEPIRASIGLLESAKAEQPEPVQQNDGEFTEELAKQLHAVYKPNCQICSYTEYDIKAVRQVLIPRLDSQRQEIERLKELYRLRGNVIFNYDSQIQHLTTENEAFKIEKAIWIQTLNARVEKLESQTAENKAVAERNEKLEKEKKKYKDTLEGIAEYWNRDENDGAMSNALWHIIEVSEQALQEGK